MDKPTLGSLLRDLRMRNGWTLKEMSARSGVPFSTLTKVEHDRLSLTYDRIQSICSRLGIRMSELFADPETGERRAANSRRSISGQTNSLDISTPQYDYSYIARDLRVKEMVPLISSVKAVSIEEFGTLLRHPGEEFVFVLEGAVVVHTEFYDPVTLNVGGSIYIDSEMGHAYVRAEGCDSARILTVCSSSQDELLKNLPQ